MTNWVSAVCFLGFVFVGIGLLIYHRVESDEARRRQLVSAFIGYVIVVSFGAGILQRNFWPFASWNLMVGAGPGNLNRDDAWHPARIVGVTADGVEHRIDYRSWQPWSYAELETWIHFRMPELPADARDRAGAYLLAQANAGREDARNGRTPGSWSRVLGPLTAPSHFFHKSRWSNPEDAPAEPFVQIRYYFDYFDVETRARDQDQLRLVLFYEYPQ